MEYSWFIDEIDDGGNRKFLMSSYEYILKHSKIKKDKKAKLKAISYIAIMCDVDDEDIIKHLHITPQFLEEVKLDVINDRIQFPLNPPLLKDESLYVKKRSITQYFINLFRYYYSYYFRYRKMPSVH